MGLIFARRGYLVFNISYRLAPKHLYPCAVEDACEALAWVAEHAPQYGGDLSKIVFAGESAGGNLVTSLAVASCYARKEAFARKVFELGLVPKAVVPACGMLEVGDIERFQRGEKKLSSFIFDRIHEVSTAYLEGCGGFDEEALELANPLRVFERRKTPDRPLPPFFSPVGARDPLVDDTRRLKRALDAMGVVCEAPEYPGEHHAFHAMIWKKNALQCWADTFNFLDKYVPGTEAPEARGGGER
jgi:acetyl esterase